MNALFFEDYEADFELTTARRTIGETEIVLFATMTGLHEAPFMSDVDAEGLVVLSGLLHGVAIAFLSVGNVRTPRPVLLGDTVRARVKLLEKRLTSKGHAGVVITSHQVRNQREEIVMEYEMTRMIKLRPAEAAAAAAS